MDIKWRGKEYMMKLKPKLNQGIKRLPLRRGGETDARHVAISSLRHSYNRTSRTLCPDNNYYEPNENSELIVGVSTSSMNNVYFSLLVQLEKNFTVGQWERQKQEKKGKERKGGRKRQKYQGTLQEQQRSRLMISIPCRSRSFQILGYAARTCVRFAMLVFSPYLS
uniref:Uncharacterized protein n=1 Tax=Timema poppense TaxID=170557 RepID=A0A7R9HC37_TIMPO|nr:unnamed protein product [Timema poppensis]